MTMLVLQTFLVIALFVGIGIAFGVVIRRSAVPLRRGPVFAADDPGAVAEPLFPPEDSRGAGFSPAAAADDDDADPAGPVLDPDRAAGADQIGVRPPALSGPRDGRADDLKLIRGIGRQNEARLHSLGIFHLDQIADWSPEEARWVGAYLAFPGRIEREDWIGQAADLSGPR